MHGSGEWFRPHGPDGKKSRLRRLDIRSQRLSQDLTSGEGGGCSRRNEPGVAGADDRFASGEPIRQIVDGG